MCASCCSLESTYQKSSDMMELQPIQNGTQCSIQLWGKLFFFTSSVTCANLQLLTHPCDTTSRQGLCVAIGKIFRGRSKKDSLKQAAENNFDLIDFFIYMVFHMIASLLAFYAIGYPCFQSQNFHLFMLVFVAWLAVTRGASRYTYYTTKMYSRTLRKQFADILDEKKHS